MYSRLLRQEREAVRREVLDTDASTSACVGEERGIGTRQNVESCRGRTEQTESTELTFGFGTGLGSDEREPDREEEGGLFT